MFDKIRNRISYVTFDGRTVVDTNALLQEPSVKRTLQRLSASNEKLIRNRRRGAEISVLKRSPVGA
jgi:hypothetical protein